MTCHANMATPLILPNFRGNLVTVLTGFHCIYQYRGRYLGFATVFYTCEDVDDVTLVTTNTHIDTLKLMTQNLSRSSREIFGSSSEISGYLQRSFLIYLRLGNIQKTLLLTFDDQQGKHRIQRNALR